MDYYDSAYLAPYIIELDGISHVSEGNGRHYRKCTNCDTRINPGGAILNAKVRYSYKVQWTCFCIPCAKRLLPAYRKVLQEKLNALPALKSQLEELQLEYGG